MANILFFVINNVFDDADNKKLYFSVRPDSEENTRLL